MNILLIRPFLKDKEIAKVLPLGLLATGSALKRAGHGVHILDLRIDADPATALARSAREFRPDAVGIGLMSIEAAAAHALAGQVKTMFGDIPVIFGGPHCEHDPEYVLHDPNVDLIVVGEGEITAPELLQTLADGGDLSAVRGIAYKKNGNILKTPARELVADLDSLPIDYESVDVEKYFRFDCSADFLPADKRFFPLMTSRGCPYGCIYCHELFGKNVRFLSPEKILAEMIFLKEKYGVREFQILDDVFNINMKRAKRTFALIAEHGLNVKISFPNGVRADLIDDEMVEKMRAAGVYRLALGIESGADRIQRMIDKQLDLRILKTVVEKLRRASISVHGFFMMGFPTETAEEIQGTIRLACDLDLTTANFSLVMPNPGTRLREMTKELAPVNEYDFSTYSYDASVTNASRVSPRELAALRRAAYRRFYFTPKRIMNICRVTPLKNLFINKTPFRLLMKNGLARSS